jgi:aspartate ammonia-lyase
MKNAADLLADSIKMSASYAISQNLSFTFLAQNEQLEGDLLMPLLSDNLLGTIRILQTAVLIFTEKGLLSAG